MGGYGSTRWGLKHVRDHTDPLLSLDVRWLKRLGALAPNAIAYPQWTRGGNPSGNIVTIMSGDGEQLVLDYKTRRYGEEWQPVRESVSIDRTPCNYGGERVWFLCPGCDSRRAVLHSVDGRFRCRACHDLAYSSSRENASDRSLRRLDTLRKRMGASSGSLFDLPQKPKGMHWSTYWRLCLAFRAETGAQMEFFREQMATIDRRIDRISRQ